MVFGVGETKDRGASAGAMPHAPTLPASAQPQDCRILFSVDSFHLHLILMIQMRPLAHYFASSADNN